MEDGMRFLFTEGHHDELEAPLDDGLEEVLSKNFIQEVKQRYRTERVAESPTNQTIVSCHTSLASLLSYFLTAAVTPKTCPHSRPTTRRVLPSFLSIEIPHTIQARTYNLINHVKQQHSNESPRAAIPSFSPHSNSNSNHLTKMAAKLAALDEFCRMDLLELDSPS